MQWNIKLIFVLIFIFQVNIERGFTQVEFRLGTSEITGDRELYSTITMGVEDINGDRHADLVVLDQAMELITYINRGPGIPFEEIEHTTVSNTGAWSLLTGDLNNDGSVEVVVNATDAGSNILSEINGLYWTQQMTDPIFAQSSSLTDFNNDGYLDLFVCNDDGENKTFLNDGTGEMILTSLIDFKTSEEDDMSGNYSSIFSDLDGDGDVDLYIGKCRAGVSDPTDRRRINTLYINNGDGTYTERAADFGLANGSQTWSVDSGDIDNDGDLDVIIANHDRTHDLMINDGQGHFTRYDAVPEDIKSFAYQSFFYDFDNNGWLDIFITEPSKSYILYNEDMSFSTREIRVNFKRPFSGVVGDFNADGFGDLYMSFASSFQSPGTQPDAIFLNETNTNSWLSINLSGTTSNRDGIGSKVYVYTEGTMRVREVLAGKSYGIMTPTVAHFGLGESDIVDSIKVEWPSGTITTIDDPTAVNQYLYIEEGNCHSARLVIPDHFICEGNSDVTISLDEEYDAYLWSDGSTDSILVVAEEGNYQVMLEKDGCSVSSNFFTVKDAEEEVMSRISAIPNSVACEGDFVQLTAPSGLTYEWSTDEVGQDIYVTESGTYDVTVANNCGVFSSREIEVQFVARPELTTTNDTVEIGEMATLVAEGDNVQWYQYLNDQGSIGNDQTYTTDALTRDTSFFAGSSASDYLSVDRLIAQVPLNGNEDVDFPRNDTVYFDVMTDLRLNSVKVRTQDAGLREIQLWKEGDLITSILQEVTAGVSAIPLETVLQSGTYYLTTAEEVNQQSFGSTTPKFSYTDLYSQNDRTINSVIEVGESTLYQGQTAYFFDWDVSYDLYNCETRKEVYAIVKDDVSTDSEELVQYAIAPNPTTGLFRIVDLDVSVDLMILDMHGRVIRSISGYLGEGIKLDVPSGMYSVRIVRGETVELQRLVISLE